MNLKILSLNMHKGFSTFKFKYTLPRLREALEETLPDIVFLQEVTGQFPAKELRALGQDTPLELLADELWPHSAYGKNSIYSSGGHHGNAILSKIPLVNYQNINISTNRLERRGVLHGEVQMADGNKNLHLFCLHLNLLEGGRTQQVRQITEYIRQVICKEDPFVIAGDFNDWRKKVDEMFFDKLEADEVFVKCVGQHARTFPNFLPVLPLDRIYVRNLKIRSAKVLDSEIWRSLSDHLPVLAELSIDV